MRAAQAILILLLCGSAFAQEHKVGVNRYTVPTYPLIARQARVQGDVTLELQLDANGDVKSVDVVSGHPMLKGAAVVSVKQWRFLCIDCRPGETFRHRFTVTFQLAGGDVCDTGISRSMIHFPERILVEEASFCVQTLSSYADLH